MHKEKYGTFDFLKSFIPSLLASLAVIFVPDIWRSYVRPYIETYEIGQPAMWDVVASIIWFACAFAVFVFLFNLIRKYKKVQYYLSEAYRQISSINREHHLSRESENSAFYQTCRDHARDLLVLYRDTVGSRKTFFLKPVLCEAALLIYDAERVLYRVEECSPGGQIFIKGRIYSARKGAIEWLHDFKKAGSSAKGIECDGNVLRVSKFNTAGDSPTVSNDSFISCESCVITRLWFNSKEMGLLIIAADKPNRFGMDDVIPGLIFGEAIASLLGHVEEWCPWHRKGWRNGVDYIPNNGTTICAPVLKKNVKSKEICFDLNEYDFGTIVSAVNSSAIEAPKRQRLLDSLAQEKEKLYRVVQSATSNRITSVNLIGEFNGWNQDQLKLTKDEKDDHWKIVISLPEGHYCYKFHICFLDSPYADIFDTARFKAESYESDEYGLKTNLTV